MKFYFFIIIILINTGNGYSQQKFCADSSIRIKYSAQPYTLEVYANPDTTGRNLITGSYYTASPSEMGILMAKTDWGDSIFWAKKYFSSNNILVRVQNSFKGSGDIMILSGDYRDGNIRDFLICRSDTSGNMVWTRRFPLISGTISYYQSASFTNKNILVTNSAIYFIINSAPYNLIGKLDFNGNLIWSKNFMSLPFNSSVPVEGFFIKNGVVYFGSVKTRTSTPNVINYYGLVFTGLDTLNGNQISSELYSIIPDNFAKGFFTRNIHSNNDGSFSIFGEICVFSNGFSPPITPHTLTRFNLQMNTNFNLDKGVYYTSNIYSDQTYQFDINESKDYAFLYTTSFPASPKYFLIYDSNNNLLRSRKYSMPAHVGQSHSDVYFDDKDNLHYFYNYIQNNQSFSEYARISDLAPANTLNCFGEDTASIFQQFPMQVTKEPFTWDIVQDNVLSSMPVTIYTEDFPIQKEVVCKQVSYCDSIKILGNPVACIAGGDARFSSFLNPQCLKNLNWSFDTTYASVVNYEADSALTLRLKQTGQFYLKAEVNNCVVKDSVLVTITQPQTALQWNKQDSLLCPGGTVTLQVNDGFRSYQWQDGSTNNTYLVTNPGLYRITATDSCGNIFTDSVNITVADTTFAVAATYSICTYDSARILLPPGVYNINWQPATAGLLQGNTLTLFPQQTTGYLIRAQKPPGCLIQKNITVIKEDCPEWVRFPAAFTPNNDGLNDLFKPGISGQLQSYHLKIFDRNGQLIFQTNNPFEGWNGRFKSAAQNAGVFVYMAAYNFYGKEKQLVKGTCTLIR